MKTIFASFCLTSYGIAYLKHILSRFYQEKKLPEKIFFENLNQRELNSVFDNENKKGFVFDEIIYFIPKKFEIIQKRTDIVASFFRYQIFIKEEDSEISKDLKKAYLEIFEKENPEEILMDIEKSINYFKENYLFVSEEFQNSLWKFMQFYPIKEQLFWLENYSNFKNIYQNKLKIIEIDIEELTDEKALTNEFLNKYNFLNDNRYVINISLSQAEVQVAWHILSAHNKLPKLVQFIKTYDDKRQKKKLKDFSITETLTTIIGDIGEQLSDIYRETISPKRDIFKEKLKLFINSGFSVLILGERGTGKSHFAKELSNKELFFSANCASFDDDSKAEAELFGYEKGAFTGANDKKIGFFERANGGILFLDEVHHLSKNVQAKLMTALQTNKNNEMFIRRMGAVKTTPVRCQVIFASNKNIEDLKKCLLPDFFDRIAQHILEIPPLRETKNDILKDWETIWHNLIFKDEKGKPKPAPNDKKLQNWLKTLPLFGNFRDLQKIAMSYNIYDSFSAELKKTEKSAFEYTKKQFENYHNNLPDKRNAERYNFSTEKTASEMEKEYHRELVSWAIETYKTKKIAAEKLGMTERNLTNWQR